MIESSQPSRASRRSLFAGFGSIFILGLAVLLFYLFRLQNNPPPPTPAPTVLPTRMPTGVVRLPELLSPPQRAQVKVREAIVRTAPDDASPELARLRFGTLLMVVARWEDWVQIRRAGSQPGEEWVLAASLQLAAALTPPALLTATLASTAPTATPWSLPTLAETPQVCTVTPPADWVQYTPTPDETLAAIAQRSGVSVEQIRQVNCLKTDVLTAGMNLYVPSPVKPPAGPTTTRQPWPSPTAAQTPAINSPATPRPNTPTEGPLVPEGLINSSGAITATLEISDTGVLEAVMANPQPIETLTLTPDVELTQTVPLASDEQTPFTIEPLTITPSPETPTPASIPPETPTPASIATLEATPLPIDTLTITPAPTPIPIDTPQDTPLSETPAPPLLTPLPFATPPETITLAPSPTTLATVDNTTLVPPLPTPTIPTDEGKGGAEPERRQADPPTTLPSTPLPYPTATEPPVAAPTEAPTQAPTQAPPPPPPTQAPTPEPPTAAPTQAPTEPLPVEEEPATAE